jgi:16S rRNA (guanine1207-N2)-methyltransferase
VHGTGSDISGCAARAGNDMSRPADAPTSVVIDSLEMIAAGVAPLVVDEASGQLAAALRAGGSMPLEWRRFAEGGSAGEAWPPAETCSSAFVRLGKDRRALAMALDAAASVVAPGGAMVLFGANAEGVKSASKALDVVAEGVVTVDTRRHSRVLAGRRRSEIAGLRGTLAAWREVGDLMLDGRSRPWVSYPGVFAGGGLDPGTALLIEHLPDVGSRRQGASVLDLACGAGIIGAVARERYTGASIDLVDADAIAVLAARENVACATVICGDGLAAAPRARYDAILSNPPIHDGIDESLAFLERLIREAPGHLAVGGVLEVVIPSRIRAAVAWFEAAFVEAAVVALDRRYQVIRGTKGPARAKATDLKFTSTRG